MPDLCESGQVFHPGQANSNSKEELYFKLLGLSSDFYHCCSRKGLDPFRVIWIEGAAREVTGYTCQEIMDYGCWISFVHPLDALRVGQGLFGSKPGDVGEIEFRIIQKRGGLRWVRESYRCEIGTTPDEIIVYGSISDITQKKLIEDSLVSSEARFRALFELAPIGILQIDSQGVVRDCNRKMCEIFNVPKETYISVNLLEKLKDELFLSSLRELIETGQTNLEGYYQSIFNHKQMYVRVIGQKVSNDIYLAMIEDISERKRTELQLLEMATRDSLTKLSNRHQFFELGERLFNSAKRYSTELAAIMFDIDHFKQTNDSHGHEAGDLVLAELGKLALKNFRSSDVLGRIGGEEFAVIMPETDLTEAMLAAERFRKAVEDLRVGYANGLISLTMSLGVSILSSQDNSLQDLLKKSDIALYAAKRNGRNRVESQLE